ncbi:MAG: aromatic ring-hydroxylating dioxygenase subunit alpha [Pseudomonadota bacterium]
MDERIDQQALSLLEILKAIKKTSRDDAHTLDGTFYTNVALFEMEYVRLFQNEWVCVGHQSEISKKGDYFTYELCGEPLLVYRDQQMRIVVRSNVCRHRFNLIAKGQGNARHFVCSYHAWAYDLEGRLVHAPYMDQHKKFDKTKCQLPEIRSHLWNGYIFVNFNKNATNPDKMLSPLTKILSKHHLDERVTVEKHEEKWPNNWKFLIENFMESYHLNIVHPKSLRPVTPTSLCKKIDFGDTDIPHPFCAYRAHYPANFPQREPYPADLDDIDKKSSVLFSIFPTFISTAGPNCSLYMNLRAENAEEVTIQWGVMCIDGAQDHPDTKKYIDLVHQFNREDHQVLANVQKGAHSRYWQQSPLASDQLEGTIWDFYRYLAYRLSE